MISLALTHYNRFDMVTNAIKAVLDDDRISDIVIMDDCSTDGSYEKLVEHYTGDPKVRVLRNPENIGMSRNKAEAIRNAKNEWVIIFDSDNTIDKSYMDALVQDMQSQREPLNPKIIYCPSFARPSFDYRPWSSLTIGPAQVKDMGKGSMLECHLNTCNYVVHRDSYLEVYQYDPAIKETDTLYFAYLWMKSGRFFYIVPGMQYDHLVHGGSCWLKNAQYNTIKGKEIVDLISKIEW